MKRKFRFKILVFEKKNTRCCYLISYNQQGGFDISNYAIFSNSLEREKFISSRLFDPLVSIEAFIDSFEYDPLFSIDYENNFGTLYTAIYNPILKASEFRWPGYIRFISLLQVLLNKKRGLLIKLNFTF